MNNKIMVEKIKQKIREIGITPPKLAEKCNIERGRMYSLLRNDCKMNVDEMFTIVDVLNIDYKDIFMNKEDKANKKRIIVDILETIINELM